MTIAPSTRTPATVEASTGTHRYEPLQPCRIADERSGLGLSQRNLTTANITSEACSIPDRATSIVITLTVAAPPSNGWLVAYPTGTARPDVSTLNWQGGATRANTTVVQLDGNRSFDVFRSDGFGAGPLIIDVIGAFTPATESTDGRFVVLTDPIRALDTRRAHDDAIAPDTATVVPLPNAIPADAIALSVNLTVVRTTGRGFFTMYAAGESRPLASTLNADAAGQFRAGATIVPVRPDGFEIYTEAGAHLIADVTGYFTGPGAPTSSDGLFVHTAPTRLRDTRLDPSPLNAAGTIEANIASQTGRAGALMLSTTMIRPESRGFVTSYAARTSQPATSSGYSQAGEVSAQFTISAASASGVAIFSDTHTELTVDLVGWFTGTRAQRTRDDAAPNPLPRQRVLAIGDSSLAGIDRNRAWAQLQGAHFDLRAVGCRRLVRASCNLGNTFPPPTVLEELRAAPVGWYDVAVIMTGYNDQMPQFAEHVPLIIGAAREAGIRRIVWITHAREFRSDLGGASAFQVYEQHNAVIRANAAVAVDVQAFEWSAVTRQAPHWLYPDGIHLRPTGGRAAADFISRAVAHITGQPCPTPDALPDGARCPDPGRRPPVDVDTLYGI